MPAGYSEDQRDQPGGFIGDPDILDTWATSSLTPQIAGGWEEDDDLFDRVFPMDMRPQGHDIIRTWLFATMTRSHHEFGCAPWKNAALSGWILDPDRKKMSKSKGNVVTPMDLFETYGTDAVRYWAGSGRPGVDTAFSEDQMKVGRKLANKLLNVTKFVLQFGAPSGNRSLDDAVTDPIDRSMLAKLDGVIADATAAFEAFDYARALERTEAFFWWFCDNYVELVKGRTYDEQRPDGADSAKRALREALSAVQRLLAPVLPFAAEEVVELVERLQRAPRAVADPVGRRVRPVRRSHAGRRDHRDPHAGPPGKDRGQAQSSAQRWRPSSSRRRRRCTQRSRRAATIWSMPVRSATSSSSTVRRSRPSSPSRTTTERRVGRRSADVATRLAYTRRRASEVGSAGDGDRLSADRRGARARRDAGSRHDRRGDERPDDHHPGPALRPHSPSPPSPARSRARRRPPAHSRPEGRRSSSHRPPPSPFDPPIDGGNGRRVVYSKSQQTVWAYDENNTIIKMHRVSGRQDPRDPLPGTYQVWSRSLRTFSINNPTITWNYMVRFAKGDRDGNIGFHDIPYQYGQPVQTIDQLGQALSGGCVRQAPEDAIWMWNWAQIGTVVVVTP